MKHKSVQGFHKALHAFAFALLTLQLLTKLQKLQR